MTLFQIEKIFHHLYIFNELPFSYFIIISFLFSQGPYTREDGFLGYNEICEELIDTDDTESWTVEWEDHHKAPYMHKGVKWVSYDDQESIRIKSYFAYQQGLAGVMTWSIDTDDFRGKCGGPTYPLLRTINNALYEKENGYHSAASTRAGSPMVSLQILTTLLFLRAARI